MADLGFRRCFFLSFFHLSFIFLSSFSDTSPLILTDLKLSDFDKFTLSGILGLGSLVRFKNFSGIPPLKKVTPVFRQNLANFTACPSNRSPLILTVLKLSDLDKFTLSGILSLGPLVRFKNFSGIPPLKKVTPVFSPKHSQFTGLP